MLNRTRQETALHILSIIAKADEAPLQYSRITCFYSTTITYKPKQTETTFYESPGESQINLPCRPTETC